MATELQGAGTANEAGVKAVCFKSHLCTFRTCHRILLPHLFACLKEVSKPRKKKHQYLESGEREKILAVSRFVGYLKFWAFVGRDRSLLCPNLQPSCKLNRRISLLCVLHLDFL